MGQRQLLSLFLIMPAFRTIVMLCALWLRLLSPAAAAPRTKVAGSCSCHRNCAAGSGPPEFERDCAPMSTNPDWVSLESRFAPALRATPESCWVILHLEPHIHNEVKVDTSGLPELSDMCVASAACFVGWSDELAESSPYEPDRRLKDCASPDCLRGSEESKKPMHSAAEGTGKHDVRVAYLCLWNSAL